MGQRVQGPRYLLRIDDVCPTMDWQIWDPIEAILVETGVKPILAVVPDNRDPKLMVGPAATDFWDRVRGWQARGWAIGLHGFQHTYVTQDAGLLNLNPQSEFAGLPYEVQLEKIRSGLEIFAREGVRANAWVAPSHSFDVNTLRALREVGLTIICDGFAFHPFRDAMGMTWVPQQFALPRSMPFGTWTFCHHPDLTPEERVELREDLLRLGSRFISLEEAVALGDRKRSPADAMIGMARSAIRLARRWRCLVRRGH
ncbi:MAG: DUF2334 domain-containing protein [Acidobacteria bacterium]|nr:DUF2334 domain-containing protein [Acidobacteriota bacterium]